MAKDNNRKTLLMWLNDAYAMENSLVKTMEKHLSDAEEHPQLHAKLEEHIEVTKSQADRIRTCIERLGGDISTFKKTMGVAGGYIQGIMNKPAGDTVIKNTLAEFSAENFEIASYEAIITAAREEGEEEVARVCEGILREEEEMADWLENHLPQLVADYMQIGV